MASLGPSPPGEMDCYWHVHGRGVQRQKLICLVSPNLGDQETFLFSVEHSFGNVSTDRFQKDSIAL